MLFILVLLLISIIFENSMLIFYFIFFIFIFVVSVSTRLTRGSPSRLLFSLVYLNKIIEAQILSRYTLLSYTMYTFVCLFTISRRLSILVYANKHAVAI